MEELRWSGENNCCIQTQRHDLYFTANKSIMHMSYYDKVYELLW